MAATSADFTLVKKKAKPETKDKAWGPTLQGSAKSGESAKKAKSVKAPSTTPSSLSKFAGFVKEYRQYCVFFNLEQGCSKGKSCIYWHEPPPTPPLDVPRCCLRRFEDLCRIETNGRTCKYGRLCPYWHSTDDDFLTRGTTSSRIFREFDKPPKVKPCPSSHDVAPKEQTEASKPKAPEVGSASPMPKEAAPEVKSAWSSPNSSAAPATWAKKLQLKLDSAWDRPLVGVASARTSVSTSASSSPESVSPQQTPQLAKQEVPDLDEKVQSLPFVDQGATESWTGRFTHDVDSPAGGYLSAKAGDLVQIQFREGDWLFGTDASTVQGWFSCSSVQEV